MELQVFWTGNVGALLLVAHGVLLAYDWAFLSLTLDMS